MDSSEDKPRSATRTTAMAIAAVAAVVVGIFAYAVPSSAASSSVSALLSSLPVRADSTLAYDRDLFDHWVDADGDGCDTRQEVLIAESVVTPTTGTGCAVTGQWLSYYDGATWTNPSDVDIDHMVPLKEAWVSGAYGWTSTQRRAFANDLTIGYSLAAVTDDVNSSKGASDPAVWMPPDPSVACRYATEWVVVKYRWNLAVDGTEKSFLQNLLTTTCGSPSVTVPAKGGTSFPSGSTFIDVGEDNPFVYDIGWLADTGITTGYEDQTFRPGLPVTRQAMAAFLYRYTNGSSASVPTCSQQWFIDVPTGSSMCGYVTWLARTGITTGYPDGTFGPNQPVSRQAMALFLQRYRDTAADTATTCQPARFPDMPGGALCQAVTWLSNTGITTGYPDGTFGPTLPVTRQAMALFLHRYDTMFGPSDPPLVVTPPPPPTTTTTTGPSVPANPGNSKNCGDFANYAVAKAWFDLYYPYYGDVAQLDGDHDGIPCELLPGAP